MQEFEEALDGHALFKIDPKETGKVYADIWVYRWTSLFAVSVFADSLICD